jgi:hypothetical protein
LRRGVTGQFGGTTNRFKTTPSGTVRTLAPSPTTQTPRELLAASARPACRLAFHISPRARGWSKSG